MNAYEEALPESQICVASISDADSSGKVKLNKQCLGITGSAFLLLLEVYYLSILQRPKAEADFMLGCKFCDSQSLHDSVLHLSLYPYSTARTNLV